MPGRSLSVRGRRIGAPAVCAALLILLVFIAGPAHTQTGPRIRSILPGIDEGLLVCRLGTADLLEEKILSTLRSGLVSSVEIHLELSDESGKIRMTRRYDLRLSFDLWEEIYHAGWGAEQARLEDLSALQEYLSLLPRLAMAPLDELDMDRRLRIRAGLKLHALAPATRERMQEMLGGNALAGRRLPGHPSEGGQELSVDMGSLIRFFYKGDLREKELTGIHRSEWFIAGELSDASN